jgi:putative molybdopterin biosynthesis protein
LEDVARQQARFINRALGSGTRLILDELLRSAGIPSASIRGYADIESSHTAVAHAVASGAADVALGIAAAAHALGLDFVPLQQEDYHLVCLKSALDLPAICALRDALQSPTWKAKIADIPGYSASNSGQVLALSTVLPWWNFPRSH